MSRKYPNGWEDYQKHIKNWEKYVMGDLTTKFIKKFPDSSKLYHKDVTKFLADELWIRRIQDLTYASVKATGADVGTAYEFKKAMMHYKLPDGKYINVWKNSYERPMGRRIARSAKIGSRKLNMKLKDIDTNPTKAFAGIKNPSKAMKIKMRRVQAGTATTKMTQDLKDYIVKDYTKVQYPAMLTDTMNHTANYQGKMLSKDQLQRSNATIIKQELREFDDNPDGDKLVMVGTWELSPTHPWGHMVDDPCEEFAEIKYFFGSGIPIPVEDSHFGCGCSCTTEVMTVREAKELYGY